MLTDDPKKYEEPLKQSLKLFEELFACYYASLVGYAYKIVNDTQAAEDIVQDVFMGLWSKKDVLDFSESIKPYLFKAVYNRSLNYLSSLHTTLDVDGEDTYILLHKQITSYNQQDSLLLKEVEEEIRRFIETLPPQCRKVYKLSREENLKNREIAEKLNISEKTVEDHIRKALRELKTHLVKSGFWMILILMN
ncbi:MAG: RNA polymerase sigma-70 factor [Tannerellaceae bacterium]|nr:RNA polymerase sigma-70 factor [Tannerellaceae bacterium]